MCVCVWGGGSAEGCVYAESEKVAAPDLSQKVQVFVSAACTRVNTVRLEGKQNRDRC